MISHFTIFEVFHDQLRECEDGELFALWTKLEVEFIYVYRKGTGGGQGKIATISKLDNPRLVEMLDTSWSIDLSLMKTAAGPKFQLIAHPPEVVAEQDAMDNKVRREQAHKLLTSAYRPVKRELNVQLRSREGRQFQVGENVSMPLKSIEKYLDELSYDVRLVGESGTVGWVCAPAEIRQRILRAQFSGYQISGVVIAVSPQPSYGGNQEKIWKEEECTANIFLTAPPPETGSMGAPALIGQL
jgi:hypothetical protein